MQRGQYEKLGNADETVRAAAASYRERMAEFAEMKVLDTWYTQVTFDAIKEYFRKDSDISPVWQRRGMKALSQTSEAVVPKLTAVVTEPAKGVGLQFLL